ncbi:hypothetical protein X975_06203, partial [Stegodyphus mimosarum]
MAIMIWVKFYLITFSILQYNHFQISCAEVSYFARFQRPATSTITTKFATSMAYICYNSTTRSFFFGCLLHPFDIASFFHILLPRDELLLSFQFIF